MHVVLQTENTQELKKINSDISELENKLILAQHKVSADIASMQGNQLPNIPKWNLQHQLKLKNDYASIQHVWFFIDQNYSESTNRYLYPTRSFHNIELASNQKGFFPSASLAFRNLLNTITEEALLDPLQPALGKREQAVSDFIGYPLPGRHLFLTLTWNTR